MQNVVPVVDDHEGTNGEGNVGVKWEGQVVYERKFQRIQKNKKQILSTMEVMRDRTVQAAIKINMAGVLLVSIWKKIMPISTCCLERAWIDCQVLKTFPWLSLPTLC